MSFLNELKRHQATIPIPWLEAQNHRAMKDLKLPADGDVNPILRTAAGLGGISTFVEM